MEEYDELIDAYLRNKLKGDLKINFEKQIQNDEALKIQYTIALEIQQALRHNKISERLDAIQIMDEKLEKKKKKERILIFLAIAVAIIGIIYINVIPSEEVQRGPTAEYEELFNNPNQFAELTKHHQKRKKEKATLNEEKFNNGYSLFAGGQFEEAIPVLDSIWETKTDTLALYYLGLCHLGLGENDKAKSILLRSEVAHIEGNPMKK